MKYIDGGVCAAKGFTASGLHCGVKTRNTEKKDVALVLSEKECAAAAVYTRNVVKAAPLHVTKGHLADGKARAILANSGNANACAPNGEENAILCCRALSEALGIATEDIIVASTGVIGQELRTSVIVEGIPALVKKLSVDGATDAAAAIMTTDTLKKECAAEFTIGGKTITIGGMAKGSGMIHPNMGTMLCFLTTDCAISSDMLQTALTQVTDVSFNRISVDGDTSTNDMCTLMANGMAGNEPILEMGEDYNIFLAALKGICVKLARAMAADGEGATHLITCNVQGAKSVDQAENLAKSVISSTLTKAAIFGTDANWGRILCAMGYSGQKFDPDKADIAFVSTAGRVEVCKNGRGLNFDEDLAYKILSEHEVIIDIKIDEGTEECTCWGCDITYDYIKINGDYRT